MFCPFCGAATIDGAVFCSTCGKNVNEDPASAPIALFCMLFPALLMIAGGILMKVNNRKKYQFFQNEYARLSQELYNHYISYPNCPFGPEYANPEILSSIMAILRSGRADTIKESINLAISDAEHEEISQYLNSIEQNTAAINAQTKVAAIFAAANFFK